MKKLILFCWFIICSLNLTAQLGKSSVEAHVTPNIGQIASIDIGENIIKSQNFMHKRAVYCEDDIQYNKNGKIKSLKVTNEYVFDDASPKGSGALDKYCYMYLCVCVDPKSSQVMTVESISMVFLNHSVNPIVSEKPIFLKEKEVSQTLIIETAFHQEFIYNGKVGNMVKFSYREFIDTDAPTGNGWLTTKSITLARPSFTQDVQYDLAEGNIVGFKGAKFEIVNASNFKLDYKILSPFKM